MIFFPIELGLSRRSPAKAGIVALVEKEEGVEK